MDLKTFDYKDKETLACFSCMLPNQIGEQTCQHCDAPIIETLSSDPLQIVYGEGSTYGKAVAGKPKPIIVLGVWITFLPTFVVSFAIVLEAIIYGNTAVGPFLFLITVVLSGFSSVMLYRITKNYIFLDKFEHGKPLLEDANNN